MTDTATVEAAPEDALIEPATHGTRYSASRLKTWMDCSLQAHFHYDEKLPGQPNAKAVFGTCIHQALELYNNTANLEAALALFKDLWHNPEKVGSPVDTLVWPKMTTYGGLRDRGIAILKDVDARLHWDSRDVIAAEHRFLVPFGDFELTGVVDLLETRRSGKGKNLLRIVDYKTSSRQPNTAELALDVQFTIYLFASTQREFWVGNGPDFPGLPNGEWLYETLSDMPRRAIWYALWTQKEIDAGPRDDADFMRLYRVVQQIDRATQLEVWVPHIGEACQLCAYANGPCPVEIPTRDQLAAQDDAWL
jgi:hypothetical protein